LVYKLITGFATALGTTWFSKSISVFWDSLFFDWDDMRADWDGLGSSSDWYDPLNSTWFTKN
jgi:hypothetical protein